MKKVELMTVDSWENSDNEFGFAVFEYFAGRSLMALHDSGYRNGVLTKADVDEIIYFLNKYKKYAL